MASKYDKITHAELTALLRYEPETGLFFWRGRRQGVVGEDSAAGCINCYGYVQIKLKLLLFAGHRLAWFYHYGVWPVGRLDHENNERADNRIVNLREATSRQNAINRRPAKTISGFRGVFWKACHKKFEARIRTTEKRLHLGHYAFAEDAARAYDAAAIVHHGEFAKLNFPCR